VDASELKAQAEKWFGELEKSAPVPPLSAQPVVLAEEKRLVHEDQVQLPRLYLSWPGPPLYSAPDPSLQALGGVLADGKNSRLYKRLVYDMQVAQDASAYVDSGALSGSFNVVVTARAGHGLPEIARLVDEEIAKLKSEAPQERELQRFVNQREAGMYDVLDRVGAKADQLNEYYFYTGDPDFFEEDLARFRALSPDDVRAAANAWLGRGRVVLSIVPKGRRELAVSTLAR